MVMKTGQSLREALERKNRKLKQLVADLGLDKQMLRDVLRKSLNPVELRTQGGALQAAIARRASGQKALSF